MIIGEITEGNPTLRNIAQTIVNLHDKTSHTKQELIWLYRMALNEDLIFLLGRYWEDNRNDSGTFDGGKALITAHLFRSALQILSFYRTRRQLRQKTLHNMKFK